VSAKQACGSVAHPDESGKPSLGLKLDLLLALSISAQRRQPYSTQRIGEKWQVVKPTGLEIFYEAQ
jgi:hypothetical protein